MYADTYPVKTHRGLAKPQDPQNQAERIGQSTQRYLKTTPYSSEVLQPTTFFVSSTSPPNYRSINTWMEHQLEPALNVPETGTGPGSRAWGHLPYLTTLVCCCALICKLSLCQHTRQAETHSLCSSVSPLLPLTLVSSHFSCSLSPHVIPPCSPHSTTHDSTNSFGRHSQHQPADPATPHPHPSQHLLPQKPQS